MTTAAFALAVLMVMAAAATAFLTVLVMVTAAATAFLAVLVTVAAAAMAMMLFLRKEFSVKTLCQLFLSSLSDSEDLTLEIHGLAGHRMIEIHDNGLVLDFSDLALAYLVGAVEHRNEIAFHKKVIPQYSIYCKGTLRQFYDVLRIRLAIFVFRLHDEVEFVAWLMTFHFFFKFRDEHAHSLDVIQRSIFGNGIDYLSIHSHFIDNFHYGVFCNFHNRIDVSRP